MKLLFDGRHFLGMCGDLIRRLADRSITKEEIRNQAERDPSLISDLLSGTDSEKANVRYGCAKILMDLSEHHPEKLYTHIDRFIAMLDSRYRILIWNAMAIIANLSRVDVDNKIDAIFPRYFSLLNDEYMVTVANLVGGSSKIALAKPSLIPRITDELLKAEYIKITPHLTEECKRVIAEKAIETFDLFFEKVEQKGKVISFVQRQLDSPRRSLRIEAENFLKKWS